MISRSEFEKLSIDAGKFMKHAERKAAAFTSDEQKLLSSWKENYYDSGHILNLDFNLEHKIGEQAVTPFSTMAVYAKYLTSSGKKKLSFEILDKAYDMFIADIYYTLANESDIFIKGEELLDIAIGYGRCHSNDSKRIGMETYILLTNKRIIACKSYPTYTVLEEVDFKPGENVAMKTSFDGIVSVATSSRIVTANMFFILYSKNPFNILNLNDETVSAMLIVPSFDYKSVPNDYSSFITTDKNFIIFENILNSGFNKPAIIPKKETAKISWDNIQYESRFLFFKKKLTQSCILIQSESLYEFAFVEQYKDRVEKFILKANNKLV